MDIVTLADRNAGLPGVKAPRRLSIRLTGIVQGVGFRPFVFKMAYRYGIKGWIRNTGYGVEILACGNEKALNGFQLDILERPPVLAKIDRLLVEEVAEGPIPQDFVILGSAGQDNTLQKSLTPDFAMCPACRSELYDHHHRKHVYPFITCTDCGPRYSILRALPVDRGNTSMDAFRQCPECYSEYEDRHDRRFHAQSNSCPACSIDLVLYDHQGFRMTLGQQHIIDHVAEVIREGAIVAVKGIGGYLLMCDAGNGDTVRTLRRRKNRPAKPFAIMCPDMEWVEKSFTLREEERDALRSPAAPIVLLERNNDSPYPIACDDLAPGLHRIGVFLPYAPLMELILHRSGRAVVATSGNISGAPLIFEDDMARTSFQGLADFVLAHNREIVMPQDDSVMYFSRVTGSKIILRSGRGLAPHHFSFERRLPKAVAGGAMMKGSIAVADGHNIYVSQYLCGTADYDAQIRYGYVYDRLTKLLDIDPTTYCADLHPQYYTHQWMRQVASRNDMPFHTIQHHKAHFAAILGESSLMDSKEKILGVIWDGTGLGEDGHIWGGEFFLLEKGIVSRCHHLDYFHYDMGDKMALDPRIAALSVCREHPDAGTILQPMFSSREWDYYNKLLRKEASIRTSSAGRLFDAVAAMTGICSVQTYEGEAALRLQEAACDFYKRHTGHDAYYSISISDRAIDLSPMIDCMIRDIYGGIAADEIALKFHLSLVKMIDQVAAIQQADMLAFSGGVFQNELLIDLIKLNYSDKYKLFFHDRLSPNDENISFGQLIYQTIISNN